jgi:hypothetical protein
VAFLFIASPGPSSLSIQGAVEAESVDLLARREQFRALSVVIASASVLRPSKVSSVRLSQVNCGCAER